MQDNRQLVYLATRSGKPYEILLTTRHPVCPEGKTVQAWFGIRGGTVHAFSRGFPDYLHLHRPSGSQIIVQLLLFPVRMLHQIHVA